MTAQQEQIAEMAKDAFKNHELIEEQVEGPVRCWLCKRPGSSTYHFRVIAAPGALIIYGDVGDNILMAHNRDMVPWIRGSVRSRDYVIEKIRGEWRHQQEFNPELVDEWFKDEIKNFKELDEDEYITRYVVAQARWKEEKQYVDEMTLPSIIHEILTDHPENKGLGDDSEAMEFFYEWTPDILWTYHCLECFVRLYEGKKVS